MRRALAARRSEFEELLDPAVRLDFSERVFNPDVYEGHDGIMRWRAEVGEVWESYRNEPLDLIEADQMVVVCTRERGLGRVSGVGVDRSITLLCRLRERRVSEIRLYANREQAMRDAGLAE